ncbi:MAG: cupin domain-containing protein [Gammaproteobacteria bacterium]
MTDSLGPHNLGNTCAFLIDGGGSTPLEITETFREELAGGKLDRFGTGKLVTCFDFDSDWSNWERHPAGDEFVCLLSGAVDMILDQEGIETVIELREPGTFTLIPAGIWHTAKMVSLAKMLFITPGEGTEHRVRSKE